MSGPGETVHDISSVKFKNNKKYKEQVLNEILVAICAMLNSSGGKVLVYIVTDNKEPLPQLIMAVIRILEQSMTSIIGLNQTVSKINFEEDKQKILISVSKMDSLITTNYNLYLPSQKQVVQVYPWEPTEKVLNDIIKRRVILEPVEMIQYGSGCQEFIKGNYCGFLESNTVQLKNLKAEKSKRTRLADRMTGKGNKFTCYVSAFANYRGGHMYYGISCDGVVEGEQISEEEINEITMKVEKVINKMIWPVEIGKPNKGKHWEIFFQPVIDEDSKPIPSTFVIVIYISPCLGGVFTEEPECYEMVQGKVEKLSFTTWKKRILHPLWPRVIDEIPQTVSERTKWSSPKARDSFTTGTEKLRLLIFNGQWDTFFKECEAFKRKSESQQEKLSVLSQKVRAFYRKGEFNKALQHLEKYKKIQYHGPDRLFFDVLEVYLEAALYRAWRDEVTLKEKLNQALFLAGQIEPGLLTATIYIFAATVTHLINSQSSTKKFSTEILSIRALEHLQRSPLSLYIHSDKKQKVHLNLATYYLGCNMHGVRLKKVLDISSLDKAKANIMAVLQSACEENPLSSYHDVQLNLVLSIYKYRQSQLNLDERSRFLLNAFDYAEKAERVAKDCQFAEMSEWCKSNLDLCKEELKRAEELVPDIK